MDCDVENFEKDPRIACKYGDKCYQKNPAHHEKFKHPQKKRLREENPTGRENTNKRAKTGTKEVVDAKKTIDETKASVMETNEEETKALTMETNEEETKASTMETNEEQTKVLPEEFNKKEFIKSKFLAEMPDDFYKFWELSKVINAKNPLLSFKEMGLSLVGPFEVLAGKFDNTPEKSPEEYLLHWRFYYDPPEFQTVIIGNSSGYHIGYFRDGPSEMPAFLAENKSESNGSFTMIGDNIFAAVSIYLEELSKSADPFKKMSIKKLIALIKKEAEKYKFDLLKNSSKIKKRERAVVAKSFNRLGIVVPFDKKSELGYRELALSNRELKVLFEKLKTAEETERDKYMVALEPVLRYASIATDECDFGTGLELGLDILFYGIDWMNPIAKRYLCSAYRLLNREAFAKITEAHMNNRKKGTNLSII